LAEPHAAKEIENSGRFKTGDNHPNYGKPRSDETRASPKNILAEPHILGSGGAKPFLFFFVFFFL
jgi:hypothetical protein